MSQDVKDGKQPSSRTDAMRYFQAIQVLACAVGAIALSRILSLFMPESEASRIVEFSVAGVAAIFGAFLGGWAFRFKGDK